MHMENPKELDVFETQYDHLLASLFFGDSEIIYILEAKVK